MCTRLRIPPQTTPTTTESTDRIPIVFTYSSGIIPILRAILKEIWPIVQINNQELFRSLPLLANRVGPKILNQLIRAEFTSLYSGKTGKTFLNPVKDCKKANCQYCAKMNKSIYFTCTYTAYRYATKLHDHCPTRNLVYLITCTNFVSNSM